MSYKEADHYILQAGAKALGPLRNVRQCLDGPDHSNNQIEQWKKRPYLVYLLDEVSGTDRWGRAMFVPIGDVIALRQLSA